MSEHLDKVRYRAVIDALPKLPWEIEVFNWSLIRFIHRTLPPQTFSCSESWKTSLWQTFWGQFRVGGGDRSMVCRPRQRLLFGGTKGASEKIGKVYWGQGGLYWKIKYLSNVHWYCKYVRLRTFWTPLVSWTVKKLLKFFLHQPFMVLCHH